MLCDLKVIFRLGLHSFFFLSLLELLQVTTNYVESTQHKDFLLCKYSG